MGDARHLAYRDRDWQPQPDAEATFRGWLAERLGRNPAAAALAEALREGTAIRLRDLVDHVIFGDAETRAAIEAAGWAEAEPGVWRNPAGLFPPFLAGEAETVWLRVEAVEQFARAHNLAASIEGAPLAPLRRVLAFPGATAFGVLERNGSTLWTRSLCGPVRGELRRASRKESTCAKRERSAKEDFRCY